MQEGECIHNTHKEVITGLSSGMESDRAVARLSDLANFYGIYMHNNIYSEAYILGECLALIVGEQELPNGIMHGYEV